MPARRRRRLRPRACRGFKAFCVPCERRRLRAERERVVVRRGSREDVGRHLALELFANEVEGDRPLVCVSARRGEPVQGEAMEACECDGCSCERVVGVREEDVFEELRTRSDQQPAAESGKIRRTSWSARAVA